MQFRGLQGRFGGLPLQRGQVASGGRSLETFDITYTHMKDLLTTNGRIPRSTFWKFYIVVYGLLLLVGFLSESQSVPESITTILGLLMFPVLLMGIIVQIKRWHDRDKSGWWVLINFIPILGGLWSLIECGFLKGTEGQNRFGPDPLQN